MCQPRYPDERLDEDAPAPLPDRPEEFDENGYTQGDRDEAARVEKEWRQYDP